MIVSLRFEINPLPGGAGPSAGVLLEDQKTGAFWNEKAAGWKEKETIPPEDDPAFRDWLVPLTRDKPLKGVWGSGPRFYPDFTGVGSCWVAYPYDLGTTPPTRTTPFGFVQPDAYQIGSGGGSGGR